MEQINVSYCMSKIQQQIFGSMAIADKVVNQMVTNKKKLLVLLFNFLSFREHPSCDL